MKKVMVILWPVVAAAGFCASREYVIGEDGSDTMNRTAGVCVFCADRGVQDTVPQLPRAMQSIDVASS
jgi:hypothetical protein